MTSASGEPEARPLARLRLAKAAVPRERAPVFHVFEEIYARAARQAPEARGGPAPKNGRA